jgi:hypothetical protein
VHAAKGEMAGDLRVCGWAYLDLNQGPLPYQGSALTV